jgi:Ca2+-binding RTX toxin-like protein
MSNPVIRGTRFNDRIEGDFLVIEDILGLRGDDNIDSGVGGDNLFGGQGDDTLFGFTGANTLEGGAGDDVLGGGQGNDVLIGNQGDDKFVDSLGANSMSGGRGDDVFENLANGEFGAGVDTISGGAGSDRFRLALSSTVSGAVADEITDFQAGDGGDVIDFNIVFSFALGGLNLFEEGILRLSQSGDDTLVEVLNTLGGYQAVLQLDGVAADDLTAANFFSNRGVILDPDFV